jgi:hypothetical protein
MGDEEVREEKPMGEGDEETRRGGGGGERVGDVEARGRECGR